MGFHSARHHQRPYQLAFMLKHIGNLLYIYSRGIRLRIFFKGTGGGSIAKVLVMSSTAICFKIFNFDLQILILVQNS
jgi:hypothetical protein